VGGQDLIELTAIGATILAAIGAAPQLVRLLRTGDGAGVSLTAATVGCATEVGWVFYTVQGRLWSAVPVSVLMVVSNVALTVAVARAGAPIKRPVLAATAALVSLAAVTVTCGPLALGMLLPLAYAAQVAPAIWCAYTTWSPSGVAAARWALIAVESTLWGVYGVALDDPALTFLGAIGVSAASSILVRKLATRCRDNPGLPGAISGNPATAAEQGLRTFAP
jgi:uncharacterized protein with PQ loop repeat